MTEKQAAPVEGQAAPETSWTDGFSDDMKGYIETKGFADASVLAESYQNLEKLRGVPAEQLLQLPADMSDAEAMGAIYDKIGRPENAEAYTNVLGDDFDADSFKAITAKAYGLGLTDGQLSGMQEEIGQIAQRVQEAQDEAADLAFSTWKDGNPEGYNTAAKVMAEVGMDESAIEGVLNGDKAAIYDMLAKVGARSAEGQVVQGEQPNGDNFTGMSPQAAKVKIEALWNDEGFTKAYLHGSGDIKKAAMARMEKLQIAAAKGGA